MHRSVNSFTLNRSPRLMKIMLQLIGEVVVFFPFSVASKKEKKSAKKSKKADKKSAKKSKKADKKAKKADKKSKKADKKSKKK